MVCTAHRLQYKTPNFPKHKYLFYTYAHGMAYSSCSVIVNLICVCVSVWYAPLAFNRGFRTFSGEGGVKVCTIPGLILLIWAICTHLIEDSGLSRGEGGGGGGGEVGGRVKRAKSRIQDQPSRGKGGWVSLYYSRADFVDLGYIYLPLLIDIIVQQ